MVTNKKTPRISVIMSVKNGEKDLHKSISSILNQSFNDWEFVICDDGSIDNTLELLNEYAQRDNRFIILHNDKSMGLAYSLNKCINESHSNILARQDADDSSLPQRFELQYNFVSNHPEYAIVGTSWYNIDGDGSVMGENHPLQKPTALQQVRGGQYMHPSWMMRKDMLAKVGYYTVNKYTLRNQDYHLVMKVLAAGMSLYNMHECLYNYTADDNMIRRTRDIRRVKGLMWILWDSYRRNHVPFWCYIFVLKPLVVHLIPASFMSKYHKKQFKKNA